MEHPSDDKEKPSYGVIAAIIITSVALLFLLVAFGYYCYLHQRTRRKTCKNSHEILWGGGTKCGNTPLRPLVAMPSTIYEAQVFTYKQMQIATNNFSSNNAVGQGGFGLVYRGVIPDGRVVAVKPLGRKGKQGDREFRVEVDMLSKLHSPYLLDLIGYCADQKHMILVYEYMPNGSLEEHLYSDGSPGKLPLLNWARRMKIALDSARGLEYLHERVSPPIIHRDFKSSNILLDENFNAKVSDFGLAKLGSEKFGGHVSTRVLGTQGYVAPEYALTGHLTTKSDVYSYGVVLLELLTGRVPVDMKRPAGEGILVQWALPYLTESSKLCDIIDPRLMGQYPLKEVLQVAAIASMCVQAESEYRPYITDVVHSLAAIVKVRNSANQN